MKKIAVVFLALLITSNASAESFFDNTIFGLAFINQNADTTLSNGVTSDSRSFTGSGFGVYLDKYYKRKFRFNSTLSYITYDDFDLTQLMLSADYLIPINGRISFFTGAALGGASQKYSDAGLTDSALGAVYGVQLGGILFINDFLMMEVGYRLRPTSIETELENFPDASSTVDDLSETYISLLLMF